MNITFLSQNTVKTFIKDHISDNVQGLLLKKAPSTDWDMKAIASQIEARQKAKQKLSTWAQNYELIFPSRLSMEQASSETTAKYKAQVIQAKTGADLCGGFGIDSFYIGKEANKWSYVELDKTLCSIVEHNVEALGQEHIEVVNTKAEDFLAQLNKKLDVIYLDPARRDDVNTKLVAFEDCSPNLVDLLPTLLEKANEVWVKASPMMDLNRILELAYVHHIHILSVKNECKELLILLKKDSLEADTVPLSCNELTYDWKSFEASFGSRTERYSQFSSVKKYIYDPATVILKAQLMDAFGKNYKLEKIHPDTHFYTSDQLIPNIPARVFEVKKEVAYKKKEILKYLKDKRANVIAKNVPFKATDIEKKLGIKTTKNEYLLAYTNHTNEIRFAICQRMDTHL